MSRVGELTTVASAAGEDLGVKTWPGVEFTSTIVRPEALRPLDDRARDLLEPGACRSLLHDRELVDLYQRSLVRGIHFRLAKPI